VLDDPLGRPHYPIAVYTYGRLEIQFQYMNSPPFSNVARREEFRRKLNEIPDVEIPQDGRSRRPSIPLSMPAERPAALAGLQRALEWYCETSRGRRDQPQPGLRAAATGTAALCNPPRVTPTFAGVAPR
jgi:hypothetical protein